MPNKLVDPVNSIDAANRMDWGRLLSAWLPVVFGVAVIMTESTKYFGIQETSAPLRHLWESIFGPVANDAQWLTLNTWVRKTGHMLGYGLLGVVFFRAAFMTLRERWTSYHNAWSSCMTFALCSVLAVAAADETHQMFIPGRTGTWVDVIIDLAGATILQMIIAAYFWRRSTHQELERLLPLSTDRSPAPTTD